MRFCSLCTLGLFASTVFVGCVAEDDGTADSGSNDPACEVADEVDASFTIAIDGQDVGIGPSTFDLATAELGDIDPLELGAIEGTFIDGTCTVGEGAGAIVLSCVDAEGTDREVAIGLPADVTAPALGDEVELAYVIDTHQADVGPSMWSHAFVLAADGDVLLGGIAGRFVLGTDDDAFAALRLLEARVGWSSSASECAEFDGSECGLQALDVAVSVGGAQATTRSGNASPLGAGEIRVGIAEETVRDSTVEISGGDDCAGISLLGALLVNG
jgi:hypothetical protein